MIALLFALTVLGTVFSVKQYKKNRKYANSTKELVEGGYFEYTTEENTLTLLLLLNIILVLILIFAILLILIINCYGDIDGEIESYQNSNIIIKQYVEEQEDKSTEKVQKMLRDYATNLSKIKELEEEKNIPKKMKWLLYFGG